MISRIELQHYRRLTDHHRRSPEARAFRRRLEAAMAELPPNMRRAVLLHVCLRMSWIAVGMRMHYCDRQCKRFYRQACKILEEAE